MVTILPMCVCVCDRVRIVVGKFVNSVHLAQYIRFIANNVTGELSSHSVYYFFTASCVNRVDSIQFYDEKIYFFCFALLIYLCLK